LEKNPVIVFILLVFYLTGVQKRENRIFDMLPESKMTFQELTDWYLGLKTVMKLNPSSTKLWSKSVKEAILPA
jgi:hypothetical protein